MVKQTIHFKGACNASRYKIDALGQVLNIRGHVYGLQNIYQNHIYISDVKSDVTKLCLTKTLIVQRLVT